MDLLATSIGGGIGILSSVLTSLISNCNTIKHITISENNLVKRRKQELKEELFQIIGEYMAILIDLDNMGLLLKIGDKSTINEGYEKGFSRLHAMEARTAMLTSIHFASIEEKYDNYNKLVQEYINRLQNQERSFENSKLFRDSILKITNVFETEIKNVIIE
jgi:hypothetical protein